MSYEVQDFDKQVVQRSREVPVLVDFWAPWCAPCRTIAPALEKIAADYAGKLVVAKVNTDDNSEWASKFNVQGIPTLLFIAGGKIVHQQVGVAPEPYLRQMVDKFLEVVQAPAA
jgi:thioredoxin 1